MNVSSLVRIGVAAIVVTTLAVPAALQAQSRNRRPADRNTSDRDRDDDDRGPKETERVDRTVAFPANGVLRVRNFSGDIRITGGTGRDVVIHAVRHATRERLDHIKLDVSTSGSSVTVDANKRDESWRDRRNNNVVDTDLEIQVPAAADLDVDAFSSELTVEGVSGEQKLKTFSGDVHVTGPRGAIDAETFSADITLVVGRDARGSLTFSSFSGDVDTALPITSTSWRRRDVSGTLPGGSGPRMAFHTFSGDLKIKER